MVDGSQVCLGNIPNGNIPFTKQPLGVVGSGTCRSSLARIGQQCLNGQAKFAGGMEQVFRRSSSRYKVQIALAALAVMLAVPLEAGEAVTFQSTAKFACGGVMLAGR